MSFSYSIHSTSEFSQGFDGLQRKNSSVERTTESSQFKHQNAQKDNEQQQQQQQQQQHSNLQVKPSPSMATSRSADRASDMTPGRRDSVSDRPLAQSVSATSLTTLTSTITSGTRFYL